MSEDGLQLTAVIRKYEEAEATINQLGDRLQGLTDAETWANKSAVSLETAANGIAKLVTEIKAIVLALGEATPALHAALTEAQTFLASTDLSKLVDQQASTNSEISALRNEITDLRATTNAVSERLEAMDKHALEAASTQKRYDELVARIPARQKAKLGL